MIPHDYRTTVALARSCTLHPPAQNGRYTSAVAQSSPGTRGCQLLSSNIVLTHLAPVKILCLAAPICLLRPQPGRQWCNTTAGDDRKRYVFDGESDLLRNGASVITASTKLHEMRLQLRQLSLHLGATHQLMHDRSANFTYVVDAGKTLTFIGSS